MPDMSPTRPQHTSSCFPAQAGARFPVSLCKKRKKMDEEMLSCVRGNLRTLALDANRLLVAQQVENLFGAFANIHPAVLLV